MIKHTLLSVAVFLLFFCSQGAYAAITLSINPADGSNTMRFREAEGLTDRKEIHIRVNSTGGKRYQVFQRLNEPMLNEKGESLDVRALQTASIGNSNGAGTLYLQSLETLGMGEQLLYTSGQGGESDTFTMAYGIDPAVFNGSGNYSGRLVFTVRAMGEPSQDESFLNIFVESRSSNWKAAVTGGRNRTAVRLKETDTNPADADFVKVAFEGNVRSEVRVSQEVAFLPQSMSGVEILPGLVRYSVEGAKAEGVRTVSGAELTRTPANLYTGRAEANDIKVSFAVDPALVATQDAGLYKGKLRYVIETDTGREESLMDLELNIQEVFTVDVALPTDGIGFKNVLPDGPAQEREVTVTVRSNRHRSYQVLQDMQTPLANEKGQQVNKNYFTMKVEVPAGVKGRTKFTDFMPMQTGGGEPVFVSDAQGAPVTFKMIYRLQGYPQMSGGNFAAPIRVSLSQN